MSFLQQQGLNNNKERAAFWQDLLQEHGANGLEPSLSAINPTSAQVLRWHYLDGYNFNEITTLLNRSISIVRNHHNRGMFELQRYYIKEEKQLTPYISQ